MQKPVIELKGIKVNQALSQETNCYFGTLYVDGVKWGVVGNAGHGGCDDILDVANGKSRRDFEALDKLIEATYAPEQYHGMTIQQNLETVCGDLVTAHLVRADYKRQVKTKFMYLKDGAVYHIKIAPHTIERLTAHVLNKHPGAVILNTLPEDQAVELFTKHAA